VIASQLRDFSKLGWDGKFYTAPEYPSFAWYEAVVNACVHRSYALRNMAIFVKMFDDRLVVESPGSFPGVVTPENIYEISDPRNPRLMDAMYYLDFVKAAHEGTRRMRDTMLEMQLPAPEFKRKETEYHLVRVTLRNNIKQRKVWVDADVSDVVNEVISKSLSEDERRVINFVAENGKINVSQVTRLTSIRSWPTAKKLLDKLVDRGLFARVSDETKERDPNAHYRLRAR
jgi:ATP-dependent DNA helicase RecG